MLNFTGWFKDKIIQVDFVDDTTIESVLYVENPSTINPYLWEYVLTRCS